MVDELDRPLAVQRRVGIGNAGDRSEPAGQGGGRAGLDGLVLLAPRFAKMNVHVDQARGDDLARGVEHLILTVRKGVVGGNTAVPHEEVHDPVHRLAGVDHAAALDQERGHRSEWDVE